jgi:hypothetical protein
MPMLARYYSTTITKRKKTHFPFIGQVLCTKRKETKNTPKTTIEQGEKNKEMTK